MIIELRESTPGVVAEVLACYIVVSEFELQSRYYIYFLSSTFAKGKNLVTLNY